jgi:hypothetical protein
MERRVAPLKSTPCGAGARNAGRAPLGAPSRRFCTPGPRYQGTDGGLFGHLIPEAFVSVRPFPVQPSKADPRSWVGRLPGASRTCACEAQARAPHPVPLSRRLMKAPSSGQNDVEYNPMSRNVKRDSSDPRREIGRDYGEEIRCAESRGWWVQHLGAGVPGVLRRRKERPDSVSAVGPVVEFIQTHHVVCQVVAFTARRAEC